MIKNDIDILESRPGMVVAVDVFNVFGTMIAAHGTTLDEHIIEKFKLNKIDKIPIYKDVINNTKTEFKASYKENVEGIKDILKNIGSGQDIEVNKIEDISSDIYGFADKTGGVLSWLNGVKNVDNYTYNHSVNVAFISLMIGKWLEFDEEKLRLLTTTGLLHDVGKALVPDYILNKPGKLTEQEFEEIKKHSVNGYRIVEKIKGIPKSVAYGVLMHHERENGKGYPMGAKGNQIHEFAKIISIADVYDAMTSDRVYHKKESPFKVLEMMEKEAFGVLDPKYYMPFLNNIANYYIGDIVIINTGEEAEISYINPREISRPILRIDNSFIDMSIERDISIEGFLY